MLRETLALAHPVIPFVTEELWDHVPGTEGLLALARGSEPDAALRDEAAEAEIAAVIEAVQALRSWRDEAGVKPGQVLPRAHRRPRRRRRRSSPGWRGWTSTTEGEPTATVPIPGGGVEIRAGDLVDREAEARKARGRARAPARGDRPGRGQARQRGLRRARRRRTVVQRERDKLERLRRELEGL